MSVTELTSTEERPWEDRVGLYGTRLSLWRWYARVACSAPRRRSECLLRALGEESDAAYAIRCNEHWDVTRPTGAWWDAAHEAGRHQVSSRGGERGARSRVRRI